MHNIKRLQTWRWLPAAIFLVMDGTTGRAGELRITSSGNASNLVFVTACGLSHFPRLVRLTFGSRVF